MGKTLPRSTGKTLAHRRLQPSQADCQSGAEALGPKREALGRGGVSEAPPLHGFGVPSYSNGDPIRGNLVRTSRNAHGTGIINLCANRRARWTHRP